MRQVKLIKLSLKSENIPDYMTDITLNDLAAYYFNWNSHEKQATWEVIKAWFKEKRGWMWEPI